LTDTPISPAEINDLAAKLDGLSSDHKAILTAIVAAAAAPTEDKVVAVGNSVPFSQQFADAFRPGQLATRPTPGGKAVVLFKISR
jgi:hypothetical protein